MIFIEFAAFLTSGAGVVPEGATPAVPFQAAPVRFVGGRALLG